MAHFFGSVQGNRGEATRLGSKGSGLHVTAASWQGAVSVTLHESNGEDHARVSLAPWHGRGSRVLLYDGPVAGTEDLARHARKLDTLESVREAIGLPFEEVSALKPDETVTVELTAEEVKALYGL